MVDAHEDDATNLPPRDEGDSSLKSPAASRTGRSIVRVTPARAVAMAVIIVAIGLTITRSRAAIENPRSTEPRADSAIAPFPLAKDALLDSAVARRLAADNPSRVLRAAPEITLPTAPARLPVDVTTRQRAGAAMAGGRDSARLAAVGSEAVADKLRARAGSEAVQSGGPECYRVENPSALPASWRGAPLPFAIALHRTPASRTVPDQPRYGVTAVGGDRLIGGWSPTSDGRLTMELNGETMTTAATFGSGNRRREGRLSAAGMTVTAVARRIDCR